MFNIRYSYNPIVKKENDTYIVTVYADNGRETKLDIHFYSNKRYEDVITSVKKYVDYRNEKSILNRVFNFIDFYIFL